MEEKKYNSEKKLRDAVLHAFFPGEDFVGQLDHYLVSAPDDIAKILEIFKSATGPESILELVYNIIKKEYFQELWTNRNDLLGASDPINVAILKLPFETQKSPLLAAVIDKDGILTKINELAESFSKEFTEPEPKIYSDFDYKESVNVLSALYGWFKKEAYDSIDDFDEEDPGGHTYQKWWDNGGNSFINDLQDLVSIKNPETAFFGTLDFLYFVNKIKEDIKKAKIYEPGNLSTKSNSFVHVGFFIKTIMDKLASIEKTYVDSFNEALKKTEEEKLIWSEKKKIYEENKYGSKYVYEISNALDAVPFSSFKFIPIYNEPIINKKANAFIPSPSLDIKIEQNTKTNIYKKAALRTLFRFDLPVLISFDKIQEMASLPLKTDDDKTTQQKFFEKAQPNKIFLHRFMEEGFTAETPLFLDTPHKIIDINKEGLSFYEDMEVNKTYYYFYYPYRDSQEARVKVVNNLYVIGMAEDNFVGPFQGSENGLFLSYFALGSYINKVRLVKDENFYYLEREMLVPSDLTKNEYRRVFRNKLFVSPKSDTFVAGPSTFDNGAPYIKLRIKSKKTNKKIDLNLKYTTVSNLPLGKKK